MSTTTVTATATATATATETQPQGTVQGTVQGKLRYLAPGHAPKPSEHHGHFPDVAEFGDERMMTLLSLRPLPLVHELPLWHHHAQLHTHGFTAVRHSTTLSQQQHGYNSFKDPQKLRQYLVPETVDMLKQVTGCKTVVSDILLLRNCVPTAVDSIAHADQATTPSAEMDFELPRLVGFDSVHGGAAPANKIHLDYSTKGARIYIRNFHPKVTEAAAGVIRHEDALTEAGASLKETYGASGGPRWALYSVWRPLKTVRRDPLAAIDFTTVDDDDYVSFAVPAATQGGPDMGKPYAGEAFSATHSKRHQWYWIDSQTPEEVLILRFFDSTAEGQSRTAGGVLHSSVELPGTADQPARESIELRCLCVW
ncbi:hypothetical protein HIM_10599 [Hirsutella minnesotensis 3608]|uniref:GA4 desaturase n=1 Tax=Hirsutella minnesotensis 3608 TaxID=1043627 RepID=A0A0F7ZRQ4_9HYPO|nr:hypothetical protein HIM_10599 [Hirsutella minnesotensis 3608]